MRMGGLGLKKMAAAGEKSLTLSAWLPTIHPCLAVPDAWVQAEH